MELDEEEVVVDEGYEPEPAPPPEAKKLKKLLGRPPKADAPAAALAVAEPGASEGGAVDEAGLEGPAIRKLNLQTDMYQRLWGDEESDWRDLPWHMLPRSEEEERKLQALLQMEAYFTRTWNHDDMDDWAFFEAEKMRGKAHNIYANTQRVAAMMRVLEAEDFAMGDRQSYFSSWSRAECLFALEYDEFNQAVKDNIDSIVRQPLEEELRERLTAIGEATLLPPTESEQMAPKFPTTMDVSQFMQENFLEGILPGVSLNNPLARYAEDIYAGSSDVADELLNMMGEGEARDGEEAAGEEEEGEE
ncbi:hypothetical protein GPECTOR_45g151 [Gonium pectorale]|uniref:Uncharacterized protein n=1 Tax=Gonium pectorale TaxID=33097 RepID=A0A150G8Y9_GONPE|nr:hypothetical protein GPECTOR_45g151 [Gonium pectorale]|eukprot:KXZ46281.1 hypothetical protein GPECTOR_45g151 [Gonium pectorale]